MNSFMTCVATLSGVEALFGEEVIYRQILVIYSACISFTIEFISWVRELNFSVGGIRSVWRHPASNNSDEHMTMSLYS